MYERHFGLSGPPFQLNPDPAFYFDSRGHANALAYLSFGVHQGEGFIVVTGEVGAGKTTLVRRLLSDLGNAEVIAAQIVSTQLEAGDLLRTVLMAFGEQVQGRTKAEVIDALERYLSSVSAVGRRALLVVDEAQNLQPEAIEELRMLSNFQYGQQAVLQSFLVGQPELRGKLQLPSMEQFKQRVIASCHLGPLAAAETRAYIEHRLHRVGWDARPRFDDAAFVQIHRWTQGIPRRINLLCNRLLLAAYLVNEDTISGEDVLRTAADFRGELGDAPPLPAMVEPSGIEVGVPAAVFPADIHAAPAVPLRVVPTAGAGSVMSEVPMAPVTPMASMVAPTPGAAAPRLLVELRRSKGPALQLASPIVCVVDTPATRLRCAALARALDAQRDMPPMLVVHARCAADWPIEPDASAALPEPAMVAHLGVGIGPFASQTAAVQLQFAALLQAWEPSALLVMGESDTSLACALVGAKAGHTVFRVAPAYTPPNRTRDQLLNTALLDALTGMLLLEGDAAEPPMRRDEGRGRVPIRHHVDDLLAGALALLMPLVPPVEDALAAVGETLPADGRFVLVSCQPRGSGDAMAQAALAERVAVLCELAAHATVLWPLDPAARQVLVQQGQQARLRDAGIRLVPRPGTLAALSLLRHAACLLVDDDDAWSAEADAVGTAIVSLPPGSQPVSGAAAQAVQVVRGLLGAEPLSAPRATRLDPHGDAGADIVGLLRRWRMRERLAASAAVVEAGGDSVSEVARDGQQLADPSDFAPGADALRHSM